MTARIIASIFITSITLCAAPWQNLSDDEAMALGWDRSLLQEAKAFSDTIDTEAVMIVTAGKVLDSWGPIDQKFNVHSIRKSFISALYGIQSAEGRINLQSTMAELGIDDNPPELTALEKTATVLDLLKARSGIFHPALYETASMKAARPARHSHAPGTFWYYNNWDFNALGSIYEQATASSIFEDFHRLIAQPIGMEDFTPEDGSYVTGQDSIHPAYPFRMTARDMARFGLLFLQQGRWEEKTIVPETWIKESTTSYSDAGTRGGYGYLWWITRGTIHLPGIALPEGSYTARGAGGHFILVIPAMDLVLVHRVNTDISGRKVETSDFAELIRLVFQAKKPTADTALIQLMNRHQIPGASILNIRDFKVDQLQLLGTPNAGSGQTVTPETRFEAASMTKPIAAFAAMMLLEQGKLDLDLPLGKYLDKPYLKNEPGHELITARMVLTHTSGFPNWRPKGKPLKLMHPPGTAYRYSGEGFLYLQRVMESITGKDYNSLIRDLIFTPLQMNHSNHVWTDAIATHAAGGHDSNGQLKTDRRLYDRPNAAYSLYTTATDYAAFILEMMRPTLLTQTTIDLMLTPASPSTGRDLITRQGSIGRGDIRFGLGWSIEPTASGPRIRHSGSNGTGFRSYVEFDPAQGHGILIFTNATSGSAFWNEVIQLQGIP